MKSAITQAADFESALTKIQQKAGLSNEATAKLGEEIKVLAVSGDVAVGIDEIGAAYERAAAAGKTSATSWIEPARRSKPWV